MSRKPKKYHFIYKTTCKVTGKFYVGMHSSDSMDDGYLGSGKILGYSRKKYGDENHVREVLQFCSSRDELKQREKEIVNEELLALPLNINLRYGGEGGWDHINDGSTQHKERCSKAASAGNISEKRDFTAIGRKAMDTKRVRGSHFIPDPRTFGMLGKKHSIATRQQMANSASGERSSQFGIKRIGINKDGKIKKILPNQFQEFLEAGWLKGFKKAE